MHGTPGPQQPARGAARLRQAHLRSDGPRILELRRSIAQRVRVEYDYGTRLQEDHIKIVMILRSSSKAKERGMPENMVCRILNFMWSFRPGMESGPKD